MQLIASSFPVAVVSESAIVVTILRQRESISATGLASFICILISGYVSFQACVSFSTAADQLLADTFVKHKKDRTGATMLPR